MTQRIAIFPAVRRELNERNKYSAAVASGRIPFVSGHGARGDGGGAIAQILVITHPESVIGVHQTNISWHATSAEHQGVRKQSLTESRRKHEGTQP